MAGVQIPNLPALVSLGGQELFEAVQGGVSMRVTLSQIGTFLFTTSLTADRVQMNPAVNGQPNVQAAITDIYNRMVTSGGGTFSGAVTVQSSAPQFIAQKKVATDASSFLGESQAGASRWAVVLGDGSAESGGNSGSNFAVNSYTDAGAALATPLSIVRSTGVATFSQTPLIPVTAPTLPNQAASKSYADTKFPISGGTITGPVTLQPGAGPISFYLNKSGSGFADFITGQTAGNTRWQIALGDATPEGGSNTGSNFVVSRYSDAGGYMDDPLTINRQTGVAVFNQLPTIPTTTPTTGGQIASKSFTDATYLPLVGGTVTGVINVHPASGAANFVLNKPTTSNNNWISGQMNGTNRWQIVVGDNTPEGGTSTGCDFSIARYNNSGSLIDTPFNIARQTGNVTMTAALNVIGAITQNGTPLLSTIPPPTASTLGGVLSSTVPSNNFATGINTSGTITYAQPSFGNLSGTIAATQLIAPTASTLGGVKSSTAPANSFATGIDLTGAVTYAQPSYSNLSGSLPAPTSTTLGGVKASNATASNYCIGLDTTGALLYGPVTITVPPPTATVLGGVFSSSAGANQFATGITTTGAVTYAQPGFSNLSGTIAASQLIPPTGAALGGLFSSAAGANQFATGVNTAGTITYAQPSFGNLSGTIAASQLIAPTTLALGGVKSSTAPTNQFATGIDTTGAVTYAQPTYANLGGTIVIPPPTSSVLGGVKSSAAPANNFATGIDTTGTITYAQPAFTNISGVATQAQLPTSPSFSGSITAGTGLTVTSGNLNIQNGGIINTSSTAQMELGSTSVSNSPYIDWHSSGNNIDYDARLQASGGSSTVGTGTLTVSAGTFQVNAATNVAANLRVTGGNTATVASGAANAKAILNSNGVFQATVDFQNNAVSKWQIGKQTDDSFILYDVVAAANVFSYVSGGTFNLNTNTAITGTLSTTGTASLGGLSLTASLNINTSTTDAILFLNSSGVHLSAIEFNNGAAVKWEMGKATDDSFFFYDGAASSNVMTLITGASSTLNVLRSTSITGNLAVSGNTTVTGQIIENSGAANAVLNLNSTGAFQSVILLNDGAVNKWQLGKQIDDTAFFYDGAAASNVWTCSTGAAFTVQRALQVNGAITSTATTSINSGAANANIALNSTGAFQSSIVYYNGGTAKWQMGKQTNDNFFLFDNTAGANVWTVSPNGAWTLLRNTNITGNVSVTGNATFANGSSADAIVTLNKGAVTGLNNAYYGATSGSNRWRVVLGDSSNEAGSNAGSNFAIGRYSDAGALLDSPITIDRIAGNVTVANSLIVNGSITQSGGSPGPAGFRNKLINGDFRINQYYGSSATTPSAVGVTYVVDRWFFSGSQGSKFNFQTNSGNPNNGFTFYETCFVSNAYTALATESFALAQVVEAYNLVDLRWGTANALAVTLSFWANCTIAGTHSGSIKARSGTRSYPFTFNIPTANVWAKYTVTIPGDTLVSSTNWPVTDNGVGLYVIFNLGSGTNALGPANAWASASYNGVTGSIALVGTASASLNLAQVQLELGTVGTTYEVRHFGTELQMCERYYQTSYDPGVLPGSVSNNGAQGHVVEAASSFPSIQLPFRTPMRTTPNITLYSPNTGATGKIYDQNTPQDVAGTTGFIGAKGLTAIVNSVTIAVGHSIYVHYSASAEF